MNNFARLFVDLFFVIQQQEGDAGEPSYNSANVPPSKFPERHFCSVCGYPLFQNLFHH